MMTPILAMTGATGFVGRATLRRAVAAGWHIRALTRRPQQPVDGVTWIAGALDRPDSLAELTADSEALLHIAGVVNVPTRADFEAGNATATARSEEHTSELQSLMRISYAVFCLKNKQQDKHLH